MQPTLHDLEIIARQAGVILRAGYGQHHTITSKSHAIDLVTETDRQSEAFLLESIRNRWPEHSILAEESGAHRGDGSLWYIDPLDGTVNFAHGVPIFSVSIAYAEDGMVRLGVVYDPMRDECFSAERGRGAFLNGQPLRVSQTDALGRALLVTGFPYDTWENPDNNLDNFARFAVRSQGVRRLGSAALDLCYVAAGRFDGYWEIRLKPWDVAAGGLIASEAGALVTNLQGGKDYLSPPQSIVAANPTLHAQMLTVLHQNG
ncbi:MAG: inositol monophosphatase [Chloroflexi bacterium]|nr:inositol monophosphatase [Chloroflexota bacterium]